LNQKILKKVLFESSRPFLLDGVLHIKKEWSMRITAGTRSGFALRIASLSAAVREVHRNNPFLFQQAMTLHAAVFVNHDGVMPPEPFDQIAGDYLWSGFTNGFVYSVSGVGKIHPEENLVQVIEPHK
jgi:hypothetical protein